jgi:putative transposase
VESVENEVENWRIGLLNPDLHTRKIVGWSMRETLHTKIALEALTMAIVRPCCTDQLG